MYDSRPRPAEGEPIEEVLPAAIGATATSAKGESQKNSRSVELARRQFSDEPRMAVMRAGSLQWLRTPLPTGAVIAVGVALLVALVALLVVLI